jgi:hypothetical protein
LRCDFLVRIIHRTVRIVIVAGCAFAFACALLIVWATFVAGSMSPEWWLAWSRLMVTGKVLVATGVIGEARVNKWRRELSNEASASVASTAAPMTWRLHVLSR